MEHFLEHQVQRASLRLTGVEGGRYATTRCRNLIILVACLLFRAYDVPDEVSQRVEPEAAGVMAAGVAV